MTKAINRNRNINDTATVSEIPLNSSTSTVIAPANPDRVYFYVNNGIEPDKACWVRLYASSEDNEKDGIVLHEGGKGRGEWEMPPDNFYTGEISAIAESGNCNIHVTEY